MRRIVLGTLVALPLALAVSASAGMEERETTTTTTYSGTISDVSPSNSTIILKSDDSPQTVKYLYNDKTVWVDPAGNTVTVESVRNQPVSIYYEKEGDQTVVTKVVTHKRLASKVVTHKRSQRKVVAHNRSPSKVATHKRSQSKVVTHNRVPRKIIEQETTTVTTMHVP